MTYYNFKSIFAWNMILYNGFFAIVGLYLLTMLNRKLNKYSHVAGFFAFIWRIALTYKWTGREIGSYIVTRLQRLQGLFVASVLLFVIIFHLANLYATQHHGVEHFILEGNNVYSGLFWIGYLLLGTLLPLAICYAPAFRGSIGWTASAAVLVIAGGLSQMYMIIIGGQAFPMDLFPGKEVSST